MKNKINLVNIKKAPAWITAVAIVSFLVLTTSFIYARPFIREVALKQSADYSALDIADAGIERALKELNRDYPTMKHLKNKITLYKDEEKYGGFYTTSYDIDPDNSDNILVTSKGRQGDDVRTVQVSIRRIPSVFKYALIANGDVDFERDHKGLAFTLINGDVHANGNIDIRGNQVFINNPNFKGIEGWQTNLFYDPDYKVSVYREIIPSSTIYSGEHAPNRRIDFPTFDYDFFRDQANFENAEVKVYSSDKKSWSVSEINDHFAPADPYEGSIILFENEDIQITGKGTITSTILVRNAEGGFGNIEILADNGGIISLVPQFGPTIVAGSVKITGNVNVGTPDAGAIIAATKRFDIESLTSTSPEEDETSHITMHGTLLLGDSNGGDSVFNLAGSDKADYAFKLNYAGSVIDRLPTDWLDWGATVIHEDYRIEE